MKRKPDHGAVELLSYAGKEKEREADKRPLSLSLYKRMLGYARPYRATFIGLTITVLLRSAQLPLLSMAFSAVINGPIKNKNLDGLYLGVAGYVALSVLTQLTLYHRMHMGLRLGEGVVHDLRNDVFAKLQTLTMSFYNRTRLGRVISRFTSDSEAVRAGVQDAIFATLVSLGQMTVAATIMAFTDLGLFAVVICAAPFYYLVYQYFRSKLTRAHREVQESFSRVTASLAESVTGMRVTQGFVRQQVNARMWNQLVQDHSEYNLAVSRTAGTFSPSLEFMNALVTAVLFIVGGSMVLRNGGEASVEDLIVVLFLLGNVLEPIAALSTMYNTATSAMAGAERVFRVLDEKPDFVDPPDAIDLPAIKGRVEFKNLSFSYEPGKPVLRDITFTAEPGQSFALVGHTGSGKSSVINLIARFYLPDSGELLIDGYDIRKIHSESLHRQMGIVLQQNFLFSGSVMDNIRLGKPGATDADVVEAARAIDVLDLIEALPAGLQTIVGERGSGLSLGQRQVVCFARAMLADPRILILDEATSSVDTLTEDRIQTALNILLSGRTSFVVAHRLSTIRRADMILVLDHGRIVERGGHEDLLATGGVYSNLYQQFIAAAEGKQ